MGAKPEFFCVFMPHINGARMRICDAFLSTLSDDLIPERVVLRNCLRKAFAVEAYEENGGVYFGKGWREFVAGNGLEMGYILVFLYDGRGGFDVKIFDHSGCEKYIYEDDKEVDAIKLENGCNAVHNGSAADKDEKKYQEDGSDEDEEGEVEGDNESDSEDKATDLSDDKYAETSAASRPRNPTNTKKKKKIHPKSDPPKQQAKVRGGKQAHIPRKTSGPRLDEHRQELRDNAVALFRPKNPYFAVDMQEQNVSASSRMVYVPRSFANEHLNKFSVQATLIDSEKRKWPVKVHYSRLPTEKSLISIGWSEFSNRKKLRVGDTCVFELVESNPLVLKVSISRAVKPETKPAITNGDLRVHPRDAMKPNGLSILGAKGRNMEQPDVPPTSKSSGKETIHPS